MPAVTGRLATAGSSLWAFRLGTGWASDCRVQPRQTDAVDQFVAREANGYKADGFSRNRNPGITSVVGLPARDGLGLGLSGAAPAAVNQFVARAGRPITVLLFPTRYQ